VTPTLVLLHSPLTTAAVWGGLPDALRRRRLDVVVPDISADDRPPYASRYVAEAAKQLLASVGHGPAVLVGHSGAGPLLPQVGFARQAVGAVVDSYLLVDAMLPRVPRATNRLQLLHLEDEAFAHDLEQRLAAGERYPTWTVEALATDLPDATARVVLEAARPRGQDYFTETLPLTEDWPDAPVGYLRLSGCYEVPARTARHRGWQVAELELHHFAMLTHPEQVADALVTLLPS
jgi:pimeloyl-ACP methyl ester carboxylesterase